MWRRFGLAAIMGIVALCLANIGAIAPAHAKSRDSFGSHPLRFQHVRIHAAAHKKVRAPRTLTQARLMPARLMPARPMPARPMPARLMPARLFERETVRSGGPVHIQVSLGAQAMTVSVGGETLYRWPISSGRVGYNTPHGTYHPQRLAVMWRSHKYHMSPMPHSIFFRGGYAIHGTYATAYLGARASHGCIRLSPGHAATLFSIVRGAGLGHTRITISG